MKAQPASWSSCVLSSCAIALTLAGAACGPSREAAEAGASQAAISASLAAPPLGWNSWNTFAEAIDDNTIKAQADAMVSSGMAAAGYQYVNLDAGWWLGTRDSAGNITVDQSKWPGGMKAIADYIHGKGLKAGIYTDAGKNGCIYWYPTNGPAGPGTGSEGHYDQDMLQFSKWGFDYVKVDWCGGQHEGLNAQSLYTQLSQAIDRATAQTGRPMVLSVCEWGSNSPWNWAPAISSLWRTSNDIIYFGQAPSMNNVLGNFDAAQHPAAQSPGHYNDPDMLMVGMSGFTAAQNRTHISLWAISGAPLIAGNNLATMSAETRAILTNRDMLSIDQDPLGKQGTKVAEDQTGLQVWSKPLSGTGRRAVLLLNRNSGQASITVRWSSLGLTSGSASVRNVWSGADLGVLPTSYTASVPGRDSVLLIVTDAGAGSYALTVGKAGTGSGTVTSSSGGISCGTTCSATYASGAAVTLTATAASGSTFSGWSGACTGAGTCLVTMTAAQSVTATFAASPVTGPVSINAGGGAAGDFVADADFSGGSTYSTTSAIDTSLLASPVPPQAMLQTERYGAFTYALPGLTPGAAYAVTLYFVESYWTAAGQRSFDVAINGASVLTAFDIYAAAGGANKAVARTFDATASSAGQIVIAFTAGAVDNPKVDGLAIASGTPSGDRYTLSVSKAGTGAGTVSGGAISCGTTCSATLASGTIVTLTASPAPGSTFAGWSDACTGTGACVVSMTAAQTVTATFTADPISTCKAASGGQSGNFNTTGAICFTVTGTINGWGCSNADGRTVTVNGTATTCGKTPLPGSSPYTFSFSAGTYAWASFYWW